MLRQVTIPVGKAKLDDSLRFYQHVLGMNTFYQAEIESTAQAALLGLEGTVTTRVAVLQSGESTLGMVGLLEYVRPEIQVVPFEKRVGMPYPLYFVISAANLPEIEARALAFGVSVPQHLRTEVRADGVKTRSCQLLDPNGVFLEMNEVPVMDSAFPRVKSIVRVTYLVSRGLMPQSKDFYKSALELALYSDRDPTIGRDRIPLGVGDAAHVNIVCMTDPDIVGATDQWSLTGMVGLMEYLEPQMAVRPYVKPEGGCHPLIVVHSVGNIDAAHDRLKKMRARIICPPLTHAVPRRGLCTEMSCLDPNGVLVVITQSSDSPASGRDS